MPQPPPARQPAKRGRAVTGAWPVAGRQWCTPVAVSTSLALSLSRFESFSFLSLPFFSFLSLPFFSFFDDFASFDAAAAALAAVFMLGLLPGGMVANCSGRSRALDRTEPAASHATRAPPPLTAPLIRPDSLRIMTSNVLAHPDDTLS